MAKPEGDEDVREKIRQQTERTRLRGDLGELVGTLNRIITGWRAYFAIGNSTKKLAVSIGTSGFGCGGS